MQRKAEPFTFGTYSLATASISTTTASTAERSFGMPDADEIPEEIATIFNVAAGFFPQANAPTSVAVRTAWGAALWPRFTVDDVCYGLARLAEHIGTDADPRRRQRREAFPDLGEVIAAADEEKRKREAGERPKLESPRPRGSAVLSPNSSQRSTCTPPDLWGLSSRGFAK